MVLKAVHLGKPMPEDPSDKWYRAFAAKWDSADDLAVLRRHWRTIWASNDKRCQIMRFLYPAPSVNYDDLCADTAIVIFSDLDE